MNEYYYTYAFTAPLAAVKELGPGIDARYEVECVGNGDVAAVASRVGLDRFDPAKLEQGTASVPWLSEVATKHNQVVCALAKLGPVLPLRLGTLFKSQSSLAAKVAQCSDSVFTFLHNLGDRREWAVKMYLDRRGPRPAGSTARVCRGNRRHPPTLPQPRRGSEPNTSPPAGNTSTAISKSTPPPGDRSQRPSPNCNRWPMAGAGCRCFRPP